MFLFTTFSTRLSWLAVCVASSLLFVVQTAAFANGPEPAPLTLGNAQRAALARSRLVAAQDFAISASRDMAIAAAQRPDPVLKFGIDNLPVSGSDRFSVTNDFMTMRRVGVMQELTRSDKRSARSEKYERMADKSAAEKTVAIANLQRDTALAWLDRYYAEQNMVILTEQAAQARREIEVADEAYRSGKGSQADVFAARGALTMIDDRSSEARRRVANAKVMLARWSGQPLEAPLASPPMMDAIRLNPATLDTELDHHPEITALRMQEAVARAAVKVAEAEKKSDWTIEVAFQQRGPAFSNMASIGFSIPIQWDQKNRQDHEVAAKLAEAEGAKADREEMLRTHVAETRVQINEWENGRERISRYSNELRPLAHQRTEATVAAYRGGKAALPEVLMARRAEIDLLLQIVQLQAETAQRWARLNYLLPDDSVMSAGDMGAMHSTGEFK